MDYKKSIQKLKVWFQLTYQICDRINVLNKIFEFLTEQRYIWYSIFFDIFRETG